MGEAVVFIPWEVRIQCLTLTVFLRPQDIG